MLVASVLGLSAIVPVATPTTAQPQDLASSLAGGFASITTGTNSQ